jgi:apolipoprotein N-acyltransferase
MFTRNWSAYSLSLLSAVLLIISQAPISLFFVASFALVPLLYSLKTGQKKFNFVKGFISGVLCYLGLVYWVVVAMNTYGGISIPLALLTLFLLVCYMALYMGLFTCFIAYLRDQFSVPFSLSGPLAWVVLEYARGIFMSGFPWSNLAHSQYNFLVFIQIASVTGTYFISFLLVAINCLIYETLYQKRFPLAYGSIVVTLVAACLVFGSYRLHESIKGDVPVSIIQGNIRQDIKFDESYKNSIIDTYTTLSVEHGKGASLVIWPETAMPFIFFSDQSRYAIESIPQSLSNHLLFGTVSKDSRGRFYNTAYMIGKRGEIEGEYSKVHLVPFGEYTPLAPYFPFLEEISVAAGNFFSGPNHSPIASGAGKMGMLICYEGVYPYISNDTVSHGADVLVNITNDAWFGKTSAPYQHFAFYIFRAIETDRFVLRAANTGISAIIDPRGRTLAKTGIFQKAVLNGTFSSRKSKTPYVAYGDYFVLLSLLALIAIITFRKLTLIKSPKV